jgi:pimeloyl-ACP methyl ester carboxylesterase
MPFLAISDHRLEYEWHGPGPEAARTLVFLHEGLGSVSGWRDVPARLALATGLGALVYSRRGYGKSDALDRPFEPAFMHEEARGDLPALLAALGVRRAVLVGHSDGASIALIAAGDGLPGVEALVLLAPHLFVEELTVTSIARLAERTLGPNAEPELVARFERHHGANTLPLLRAWTGVWLSPAFRAWDIRAAVSRIARPVLAIQGADDEYGTLAQLEALGAAEKLIVPRCGHAPHLQGPDPALKRIERFLQGL